MAGKGSEIGKNIEELKYILENINSERIGLCLDTCHI
ncbi:endonuclease IV [Chlamydia abortus]|nr:endonuclease IV [Chlamydia abortus]